MSMCNNKSIFWGSWLDIYAHTWYTVDIFPSSSKLTIVTVSKWISSSIYFDQFATLWVLNWQNTTGCHYAAKNPPLFMLFHLPHTLQWTCNSCILYWNNIIVSYFLKILKYMIFFQFLKFSQTFIAAHVVSKWIIKAWYCDKFQSVMYCVNTTSWAAVICNSPQLFILSPLLVIYHNNVYHSIQF